MSAPTFPEAFDEETFFEAPPPANEEGRPGLSAWQRVALALVGVGLLSTILQVVGGPLAGTWTGLVTSLGFLSLGGGLAFWAQHRGTPAGIQHDGVYFSSLLRRGGLGWVAGILMTGFYVLVYWFPAALGHTGGEPTGLVRVVDPFARALQGKPASQWFLYGVLYTLAIAVFAVRMVMKYRHNRYHLVRTGSVTFFQLFAAFLMPQVLERFQKPYMEFNGVWPLKQDYLWPDKVSAFTDAGWVGGFLLLWALLLALVATPVLTYFYGKRWYCSWVCGCGGLAETLGDPWRQLSDKSTRAWKVERWMIHSVLVLVVVTTALLWLGSVTEVRALQGVAGALRGWYWFAIGAVFSGVVGVGFYPLMGSRVWCRFGCPQAAILGLLQRFFSRFRITTNGGQCMSCGNCSTYCEMGIDVRAYAQREEPIVRASCVGCGVCAAVCPRGVLRLENGSTHVDRFAGADRPLDALLRDLREPPSQHG